MTSWTKKLQAARGSADDKPQPFVARLRAGAEAMARQGDDPWEPTLQNLKGRVVGGVERIATAHVFEALGVPPRGRSSDLSRRLSRKMIALGWSPIRAHGLNERSFLTRVRGFARPADHEGVPLQPPSNRPGRRQQPLM